MENGLKDILEAQKDILERQEALVSWLSGFRNAVELSLFQQAESLDQQRKFLEMIRESHCSAEAQIEKVLSAVHESCKSREIENLAVRASQQEVLVCLQEQAGKMEQADQKLREIVHGNIFRRIGFLQARMIYLERLVQSNMLDIFVLEKAVLTLSFYTDLNSESNLRLTSPCVVVCFP